MPISFKMHAPLKEFGLKSILENSSLILSLLIFLMRIKFFFIEFKVFISISKFNWQLNLMALKILKASSLNLLSVFQHSVLFYFLNLLYHKKIF